MRILVQPVISTVDLRTDANAQAWVDILQNIMKITDDVWFYVLLPKGFQGYEVFKQIPKCTLVLENRHRRRFFEEVDMVDCETVMNLFNMRIGLYPIDVVLTEKTGIALLMQKLISDVRYAKEEEYVHVPVLVLEDRVWARKDTHQFVDWQEFALRALSYASVKSVVLTDFEKDEAIDASKQYLSDRYLKKLKENMDVVHLGCPIKEVEEATKDVKKRDRFTLFWGGRLSAQKRVDVILEQYCKMFEFGRDVDILITTPHVATIKFVKMIEEFQKRNSRLKIEFGVDRQRFLKLCAESHVWLSASMYEGFTVGHVEMAATGTVGIVPRRPWSIELFGADYPLMYDSDEEAAAMLRWVYDNYDKAKEIAQKTREKFRNKFSSLEYADMVLAKAQSIVDDVHARAEQYIVSDESKTGETVRMLVDRFRAAGFKKVSLYWIVSEFKKFSYGGVDFGDGALMSYPSLWDIRMFLKKEGFKEIYESEVPMFEV